MPGPLRYWLLKAPQPHAVRGTKPDGESVTATITSSRSKWADAEGVLEGCEKLEALDKSGNVVRAIKVDLEADESDEDASPPAAIAKVDDSVMVPASLLKHFAGLLADAHDRGAKRHAEAHSAGFDALTRIVTLTTERLSQLEKAWHKFVMVSADPKKMGSQPDTADTLLAGLVAAVAQRHVGPTNGQIVETEGEPTESED